MNSFQASNQYFTHHEYVKASIKYNSIFKMQFFSMELPMLFANVYIVRANVHALQTNMIQRSYLNFHPFKCQFQYNQTKTNTKFYANMDSIVSFD